MQTVASDSSAYLQIAIVGASQAWRRQSESGNIECNVRRTELSGESRDSGMRHADAVEKNHLVPQFEIVPSCRHSAL